MHLFMANYELVGEREGHSQSGGGEVTWRTRCYPVMCDVAHFYLPVSWGKVVCKRIGFPNR